MSAASSLASTLQQLAFGVGIAYGALALHLAALWNGRSGGFTVADFHLAFLATAALALFSAFSFTRLAPDAGATTSGHQSQLSPEPEVNPSI